MSWDNDAMSVLPQDWQDDICENFSPEYLAEKLSDYIALMQQKSEWLSVSEPMTLSDCDKVWALWDDGEIEIATYMDWSCAFQRKCGTDEGQHGWNGNVGQVTHYIPLTLPEPPK